MANVNLGKVALTPKGNWDNTITYEKLDSDLQSEIVSYTALDSGNMIDVSAYEGETHKITSNISVSTATTTFYLFCCGKNHLKMKLMYGINLKEIKK